METTHSLFSKGWPSSSFVLLGPRCSCCTNKHLSFRPSSTWGEGVNWVNFWQICAAGISGPLPNYSLFCSQEDPISVAFEQKYFLQSQLTHFLSLFKPWIFLFLNPQLPEFSHPQHRGMCKPIAVALLKMHPHYSQSSRENVTLSNRHISINLRSGSIFVLLWKLHSGGHGENVWELLKLGLISGYISISLLLGSTPYHPLGSAFG